MDHEVKLSDLPPQEQAHIVENRQACTQLLQRHALCTGDPLALMALELDALARREGLHMEYQEGLDPEEIA